MSDRAPKEPTARLERMSGSAMVTVIVTALVIVVLGNLAARLDGPVRYWLLGIAILAAAVAGAAFGVMTRLRRVSELKSAVEADETGGHAEAAERDG